MSDSIWLLLGLLLLSYLGSNLVGGRAIRGFGLPSNAEYLVLGFAIGPHALQARTSSGSRLPTSAGATSCASPLTYESWTSSTSVSIAV